MFGLDAALGSVVSSASGGDKGAKTRAKTHLNTDQTLTTFSVAIPLVLLIFVRTFAPKTFSPSSILCSQFQYETQQAVIDPNTNQTLRFNSIVTKSPNGNRFFMNNYCWEQLQHTVLDDESGNIFPTPKDGVSNVSLQFHRLYPYIMFCILIVLSTPLLFWTNYAVKHVQHQAEYVVAGVTEAMNMNVQVCCEMVESGKIFTETDSNKAQSKENEASIIHHIDNNRDVKDADEIYNLFKGYFSDKKETLSVKFNAVKEFMQAQSKSTDIVLAFILYRLANMFLLVMVSTFLYKFTLHNTQSEFNCYLPLTDDSVANVGQVNEITTCSISGVKIRVWITFGWIVFNGFLLISAIIGSISEYRSVHKALNLITITDPVLVHGLSINELRYASTNLFGLNNLAILLMLAKRNFTAGNKVFQMSMQAEKQAQMVGFVSSQQELDHDRRTSGISGGFLRALTTQVLWARKEQLDDEVNTILKETKQARN